MVPVLCFRLATFASPQTRNLRFTLAPQSKNYSLVFLLYQIYANQQGFPQGSFGFSDNCMLIRGLTITTNFFSTQTMIGFPQ